HPPQVGLLAEPHHLGTYIAFGNETNGSPDFFVLTNGHTVNHIVNGKVKWSWTSEDKGSLVTYSNLITTSQSIYVIGLAKSFASYTLHVTTLSPVTGEVISTSHIPSSISNGLTDFIVLDQAASRPHIVWVENNNLQFLELSPTLQKKPSFPKDKLFTKISDVGLGTRGLFVALKEDGTGHIMAINSGFMESIKEFESSAHSESATESLYAGGLDKNETPYVARVYWSHALRLVSVELYAPYHGGGQGLLSGFSFAFDTYQHGVVSHVTFDAANPQPYQVIGRIAITTSTGSIQLWQQDTRQWTREEGLADINAVQFVELPEKLADKSERSEGSFGRFERQLRDAKDFPKYLMRFVKRFATGAYESVTSPASAHAATTGIPSRDTFGFRQLIVAATTHGKVYGIDSSNGKIIWSRILGLGSKAEDGAKIVPIEKKLFVVKTVGDVDGNAEVSGPGVPEVVLVGKRGATTGNLLYHFNALTGEDVMSSKKSSNLRLLQGTEVADSVIDAYCLNAEDKGKVVVVLDSEMKVHLYPDTTTSRALFSSYISSFAVPIRLSDATQGQYRVVGHQITASTGLSKKPEFSAYPTWTLSLPEGEDIQSIVPSTGGPVASIGKVLGNRTTLYKYLNQRMFILLTEPHSRSSVVASSASSSNHKTVCGLYLVDSLKGSIVYKTKLPVSSTGSCDVKAVLTENWLVYHYYDDEYRGTGQAKGYRIVSVELYEGKQPDDKIRSSDMTSYSDKNLDITAYAQSFVYLHGVTAIATTSTKFGITSKDIIVANTNNKIQSLSRRLLNPRRPIGRKPTTEEIEEQLVQYDPLLPDDPRRVISHRYVVANTRQIITSPALLESTSLVFAYGLDLFLTRVAPSSTFDVLNENFNKMQLVLTVSGLAVAILITKPMVHRKRLKEKWYQ
ncbi:DUF1620-domain-containing protein, partial [Dendrothele bispora CBS 962.96]